MTQVDLIYEVYRAGADVEHDRPLYEAADGAGARLACRSHYADGGDGELVVYLRGVKVATVRNGTYGVVYGINQGVRW